MDIIKTNQDNLEILQKVVEGKDHTEDFIFEGLDAPLKLRPLTSMEIMELQKIEKKGQKAMLNISQTIKEKNKTKRRKQIEDQIQNMESELDYGLMKENQIKVKFRAVSLSANIPEEVTYNLTNYILDAIFDKVTEISKITKKELDMIIDFREDESGEDDN